MRDTKRRKVRNLSSEVKGADRPLTCTIGQSSLGPARQRDDLEQEHRLASRKSIPALAAHPPADSRSSSPKKRGSPAKKRQSDYAEVPARPQEAREVEEPSPSYEEEIEAEPEPEPEPEPERPQPPSPSKASPSTAKRKSLAGRASLGNGTPVGVQYMVPTTKVKTTPPQFAELLKQREAASAGRVVGPAPRERRSSSPVEVRGRRFEGRSSMSPEGVANQRAIVVMPDARPGFDWAGWSRLARWVLLGLTIAHVLWWREEKLAAGFCDTGSRSNPLVASRRTSLTAAGLPDLPPSVLRAADRLHLRPTCTPCPQHGHCRDGNFVGCTLDYVPRQSPLRLGGLLPIPPKCVPDTEKLMMVAMQASRASRLLRQRRGEVVCKGMERMRRKERDEEAWVFGLQAEALLTALRSENERAVRPFDEDVLEEVNRLALRDLESHGEVKVWRNGCVRLLCPLVC